MDLRKIRMQESSAKLRKLKLSNQGNFLEIITNKISFKTNKGSSRRENNPLIFYLTYVPNFDNEYLMLVQNYIRPIE